MPYVSTVQDSLPQRLLANKQKLSELHWNTFNFSTAFAMCIYTCIYIYIFVLLKNSNII